MSARPGSGFRSSPTSMSWYFTLSALTNPASALRPRRASRAASPVESFSRTLLSCGTRIEGRDRFSGASIRRACMPFCSASSRILSSRTVLPTPRNPIIITLRLKRPALVRPSAIRAVSRTSSRPAISGGRVPAPGAYGLRIGSMSGVYSKVTPVYKNSINSLTLL